MHILKILTDKRKKGNIAESAVCRYLKKRHYKILHRNYVAEGHEIDIIAENKEHICFVEVKSRSERSKNPYCMRPADAVDRAKKNSIITAARAFTAANFGCKKYRFDVAEVFLGENSKILEINYLESAFTLSGR